MKRFLEKINQQGGMNGPGGLYNRSPSANNSNMVASDKQLNMNTSGAPGGQKVMNP